MMISNLMVFGNFEFLSPLLSGNQNLKTVMFYHDRNRHNRFKHESFLSSRGKENRPLYEI